MEYTQSKIEPYTQQDFENEVLGVNHKELVNIIRYKLNIILQGAPGVGKTYSARRLCWLLMGCKDNSRIVQVQFHASYTYEDFIQGLRPTEAGTFKLENGPFFDLCVRASRDRKNLYFIIIDEINRGNISAILGEMFSLIEKDHRDEVITLKYNKQQFAVPKNLIIIGTMNTADRGLAVLDYALRRRFAFYAMPPAFNTEPFKKRMASFYNQNLGKLLRQIKLLNEEICKDELLGPGFQIGHSYFMSARVINNDIIKNIVEYEIIPLLQEYWYDDIDNKAEKWSEKLRSTLTDGGIR